MTLLIVKIKIDAQKMIANEKCLHLFLIKIFPVNDLTDIIYNSLKLE